LEGIVRIKLILLLVFVLAAAVAIPGASEGAISAEQLLAWVVGGISEDHAKVRLETRGIAFQPDIVYLDLMKSVGASQELQDLLLRAVKPAGAVPGTSGDSPAFGKLAAGARALGAKNDEAARGAVITAVKLEPNNADLEFALGGIYRYAEDWEQAARAYHEATHIEPAFMEAHLALSYACYRVEDADCAQSEAKLVLEKFPNDAEAHKDLGLADQMRGDDQGAEREYREALRLKPNYAAAYNNLGLVLDDRHDFAGARAAYEEAIRLEPDGGFQYYNLGNLLSNHGDFAGSVASYRKAIDLNPNYLPARQNLASELCNTSQFDEAAKAFRELLAKDPDWNMARGCYGKSLYYSGHQEEAIVVWEEALRRDPSEEMPHLGLGNDLMGKLKYAEALKHFQQAEQNDPASPYPHWNMGLAYYYMGKFEPSTQEVREALRLDPQNTRYMGQLAWDYEAQQKYPAAEGVLNEMIGILKSTAGEKSAQVGKAQGELAYILGLQGKYDDAKPLFSSAIEILQQDPRPGATDLHDVMENYRQMLENEKNHRGNVAATATGGPPQTMAFAARSGSAIETKLTDDLQRAMAAQMENKPDDAVRYYRLAVEGAGKLPPKDPRIMRTQLQFAGAYDMFRQPANAETQFMIALSTAEANSGAKSPDTAQVDAALAQHYLYVNVNLKEARKYAQRNYEIRTRIPGMADPNLTAAIELLGQVEVREKEYDKAEALFQQSISITEKTRGPEARELVSPLDNLAALYTISGQFPKAEPVYRRMIAVEEKAFGENSPVLLGALAGLTNVLRNEGRGVEANEIDKRRDAIQSGPAWSN
jgi:tetratricopeptide (TPR) repeat protein